VQCACVRIAGFYGFALQNDVLYVPVDWDNLAVSVSGQYGSVFICVNPTAPFTVGCYLQSVGLMAGGPMVVVPAAP